MKTKAYLTYFYIFLVLIPTGLLFYAASGIFPDFFNGNFVIILLSLSCIALLILLARSIKLQAGEKQARQKGEKGFKRKEEEYLSLLENAGGVLYRCNHSGRFTWLSKTCEELTGYPIEELKGKHFTSIIVEDWRTRVEEFYLEQNSRRFPETVFRFPIITKDGYKKWVEQTVVFLFSGGHCTGYQGLVKDITDKKLGEDLLFEANQKLTREKEESNFRHQAILDHIPMIIYIKDLEGRFVMVNKEFHKAFGTRDAAVVNKKPGEIHSCKKHVLDYEATDEEIKKYRRSIEREDLVLTAAGERNMLVTKFPLFDSAGKLFAIGGVDTDITDDVRAREGLIQARLRAERAEKMGEEFLASMSHEIRTPLNGIVCMTDLLMASELNSEQKEYGTLVQQSSSVLLTLINDLLDLSKIKAGRMTIEKHPFQLKESIEKIMAPFILRGTQKGIRVELKITGDLPARVLGDEHKLLQVLNNLLGNALKFTERGEVCLSVGARVEGKGTIVEFQVRDTGVGINPESINSIFDSFVQAGDDTTRKFGGTGLGLSITKRLIELQGGSITCNSTAGEGSCFCFELGYSLAENIPNEKMGESFSFLKNVSLQGTKILVVEDNLINQKALQHLLGKHSVELRIAGHGKEAIALLQDGYLPHCILMDLQMPVMNGWETTKVIRQELQLDIPIIALTANALVGEKAKCLKAGMTDYLTKPFVPSAIIALLQQYTTRLKTAV